MSRVENRRRNGMAGHAGWRHGIYCLGVLWSLLTLVTGVQGAPPESADAGVEFFEQRVRPLLAERCFKCHGPEKQWAGLRLDSRAALLSGGDSGAAIVSGKPAESPLLMRVTEQDPALRMPPAESGQPLAKSEIAALAHWIESGAAWPAGALAPAAEQAAAQRRHWAFQPLRSHQPPEVANALGIVAHLDHFVLHRLRQEQLDLSPPADRATLIRRATYDLLGLPPTATEVDSFVNDGSPDAYARLIDRLLASPRYGERWGRHWLDVARYSDTKGYVYAREEKSFVHANRYRDWVVRAFNQDLPYDQFLLLQLAADQIATNDESDLAAMGFLTLGRRFLGVTPDIIDDRIDVVTRGMLGLTVSCARCHDHKYDPIPTADYYSLYGVFQNCRESMVALPRAAGARLPAPEFMAELEKRQKTLADAIAARSAEASERARQKVADYLYAQRELEKYPPQGFDQILTKNDLIPPLVWRWQNYLTAAARGDDPIFTAWRAFASLDDADFPAKASGIVAELQRLPSQAFNRRMAAAFQTPPSSAREVADRYGEVFGRVDQAWRELCAQAQSENRPPPAALPEAEDEAIRQLLYGPESPCVIPDEPIVNTEPYYDSATVTELWKLQGEVDRWLQTSPELAPYTMILSDRPAVVEPRIFRRGNPVNNAEETPRQFLAVLSGSERQPFVHGSGRLEMARAVASSQNPLTARVWVNRVWMHHFGKGLVRTPSDFGLRAEPPSHPELLDWLSEMFIASGWSTKALHRQIMLSATYRQRSRGPEDPAAAARAKALDPENRLLWRMNARRLGFEELRDTLVAVAGDLDPRLGGPPVEFFPAAGSGYRRSLYGHIDRQFVPSVLRNFDFANPDLHAPQRSETTIPQQALFALNHPFVAGRAEAVANLAAAAAHGSEGRVVELYRLIFQRLPTESQLAAALQFLKIAGQESAGPRHPPESQAWSYGYGEVDAAAGRLKDFKPLPHFTGSAWQGGERWPDAALGWVQLTAEGGHAGNDLKHAAVRRWTAPAKARISVRSRLVHDTTAGDGIRGWIISNRQGILGQATAHNATVPLDLALVAVTAGETLDFVVDYHANLNNDQFLWSPVIERIAATGEGSTESVWNARRHFAGTPKRMLGPWAQLAQVLLLSNELMFVD